MTPSAPFIPPHIAPPDCVPLGFRALRDSVSCVIRTWPRQVYEEGFYCPPAPGVLMVTDIDAVRQVLVTDAESFPQSDIALRILKPVWRGGIAAATGESWRTQRRVTAPVFTPKAVEPIVPSAQLAAERLADEWRKTRGPVEIHSGLAAAVTQVVFDVFLAAAGEDADRREFCLWGERLASELGSLNLADLFRLPAWTRRWLGRTAEAPADELHRIVARLVGKETARKTPLLALLASEAGREPSLSRELLQENIVGSLSAGRETTALALSWSLWLIARHKPTHERLLAEIAAARFGPEIEADQLARVPLARHILLEALRLYPPVPQILRRCVRETMLGERRVRKGTMIAIPIYALHRHRKYWEAPDAFEPDRFAPDRFDARGRRYCYMPFGGGPRVCVGMAFALVEAHAMLVTLLRNGEVAPDPDEPEIAFEVGATLRPKNGLRILFN